MMKKILLVEDEALIAMNEAQMLKKYGYEVVNAYNGEKAVKIAEEDPEISLILMDIDLGRGMDGTETAQEVLKKHDIPIIFLTSHSEPEIVEKTEKITAYGYVVKNSDILVLDASIKMAFKLFEEKQRVREHQNERDRANEKLLRANQALQKRNKELYKTEKLLSNKIDLLFNPETGLETIRLQDLIQTDNIQAILNNVHELTGMVTALLDLKGTVLVSTGWKDICTKFHRVHPLTAKNCTESDLYLSDNLKRGEFIDYKCKNGLWDVITPLFIGDKHIGNIYTGQFFYSTDAIDEGYFSGQAEKYGFEKDAYLKALREVPVYNKETVHFLMNYLIGFFELVSAQSYTNIALAKETLEHKSSRKKLQKSQYNLRITLNSIGDAVISTALDGTVVMMNPIAEKLTGWTIDTAKGKSLNEVFHIIHANTRGIVNNPVEKVIETGTIVGLANHTVLISKNMQEYQIADSAAPIKDDEGNINGVVLVFRDVTDQYEKNRQIERYVSLLEETQKLAHIGSWELDLSTYHLAWSDEIYRIFGLEPQEFGANYDAFLDAVYPEDRDKVNEAYTDSVKQNQDGYTIDHRIVRKDNGEIRFVHEKCIHIKDENGTILRSVGMVQDITRRKEAEEPQTLDDERGGKCFSTTYIPIISNERRSIQTITIDVTEQKELRSIEWMLSEKTSKKEDFIPEYGDVSSLNTNGLILTSVGKEQLKNIASEYLDLLESSTAIYEKNGDYALGIFSSGWCQLMDTASRRLCKTEDDQIALESGEWLCHESCWKDASLSMAEGKPVELACNGGIHMYAVPIEANGEIVGAMNFGYGNPPKDAAELQRLSRLYHIPIDELRKNSEAYKPRPEFIIDYAKDRIQTAAKTLGYMIENILTKEFVSQEKLYLRSILQTTTEGFWVVDSKRNITQVNDAYCRMSGYSEEEFQGMKINELDAEDRPEETDARIKRTMHTGSEVFETKHRRKDGSVFDVEISTNFLNLYGGQFICFCRDITERKEKEDNLQKALEEKDYLMKELHHRVKNNLAMVSSLISLKESETRIDLSSLKNRIETITRLHDELSRKNDMKQIEVKDYFQKLLTSVFSFQSNHKVHIVNTIEEVIIPSKIAIPLGLIVNEIATNAIKYGFASDKEARFTIEMTSDPENRQYILILSNTGNPFPDNIGLDNPETMGLQLVSTLVDQLHGTLELQKEPNTAFTIRFPVSAPGHS